MGSLFGGGKKSQTTRSKSKTRVVLPEWIDQPLQGLTGDIFNLSQQAYRPYTDDRLAQFSPEELASFQLINQQFGMAPQDIASAQGVTADVINRGLGGYDQATLNQWMNPYITNVLDVQKGRALDQFDLAKNQLQQQQGNIGAFGGSRAGLAQQSLYDNFSRQLAESETTGLANAYESAQNRAFQNTQMAGQAAMDYANLAGLGQSAFYKDTAALQNAGAQQRAMEQQGLDISYQDFLTKQAYPYQQAQFGLGSLLPVGQLVAGSNQSQVNTQTQSGGGGGLLGTALALGSMALGIPGIGAGLGSMLGGGSFLGGMAMGGTGLGSAIGAFANPIMQYGLGGSQGAAASYFPKSGITVGWNNGPYEMAHGGLVKGYAEGGTVTGFQNGDLVQATPADYQRARQLRAGYKNEEGIPERELFDEFVKESVRQRLQAQRRSAYGNYPELGGVSQMMLANAPIDINTDGSLANVPIPKTPSLKLSDEDVDLMTRTLYGEGRGEDIEGKIAIINTARNRAIQKGVPLKEVLTAPGAFSAWNKKDPNRKKMLNLKKDSEDYKQLHDLVRNTLQSPEDNTDGATHYYNPRTADPTWGSQLENPLSIGNHRFGRTAFAEGGLVGFLKDLQRANQEVTESMFDPEEGLRSMSWLTPEGRENWANSPLGSALNRLGKYEVENPKEALGALLMTLPASRALSSVGKGALKLSGKAAPTAAKGLSTTLKSPLGRDVLAGLGGYALLNSGKDPSTKEVYDAQQAAYDEFSKRKSSEGNEPLLIDYPMGGSPAQDVLQEFADNGSQSASEALSSKKQGLAPFKGRDFDVNMPLIKFGAAMMSSREGFWGNLSRGLDAYEATKDKEALRVMTQEKALREYANDLLKLKQGDRELDIKEIVAKAALKKTADPYTKALQQARLEKIYHDMQKPNLNALSELVASGQLPRDQQDSVISQILQHAQRGGGQGADGTSQFLDYMDALEQYQLGE